MGGNRPYDSAEASHRALRGIQQELERHPAIGTVRGFPSGEYTQVVGDIATTRVGIDAEKSTITVRWFAGQTPDDPPEFSFHYSDGTTDFGWHHEPNPHVDGMGHFQERPDPDTPYSYEPYTFASKNPTRVVWEVMSVLTSKLDSS